MTTSKIFIYASIYLFFLLNSSLDLFAVDIRSLKDTNNLTSFDKIETLSFHNINLIHIEKLKGKKVKHLVFKQCFGNINDILSVIDMSSLKGLSISESIVLDTLINLDGASDIEIGISRNYGWFKFSNLNMCKGFSCEYNTMHLDINEFNPNIELLHLININPLFVKNISYLENFTKLENLWLDFGFPIEVDLNLENLTELQSIYLDSFTSLPSSINTTSLESLLINKIYNLDTTYLNSIIGNNPLMTSLSITNCNLKSIPENALTLPLLEILRLSENKIASLDYSFSKMGKLGILSLDNNNVSNFNYDLFALPNIYQIDLRFNNLDCRINQPEDKNIIINQDGNPFDD